MSREKSINLLFNLSLGNLKVEFCEQDCKNLFKLIFSNYSQENPQENGFSFTKDGNGSRNLR